MTSISNISNRGQHILEVWGDFACFARPDMKVERYSYPLPTPSAARGVFEAIYFKPRVLLAGHTDRNARAGRRTSPCDETRSRTRRAQLAIQKWMTGKSPPEPHLGRRGRKPSGHRYEGPHAAANDCPAEPAVPHLCPDRSPRPARNRSNAPTTSNSSAGPAKASAFSSRRLGCREFVAFFQYVQSLEGERRRPADYTQDLGLMLYDVFDLRQTNDQNARPFVSLSAPK